MSEHPDTLDARAFRHRGVPDDWDWAMEPTTDGWVAILLYRQTPYHEFTGKTMAEAADRAREWLERTT